MEAVTPANGDGDADADTALESALDAVYRAPRAQFVSERNAAAKALAARGLGDAAGAVKACSKPNISAWTVNQLWWTRRDAMEALIETGRAQVLEIQRGAGPAEQAATTKARRRAIDRLLGEATEILTAAGHTATMATMRKVGTSLEALAVLTLAPNPPHPGRLSRDLQPPGFAALMQLAGTIAVVDPSTPDDSPTTAAPSPPNQPSPSTDDAARVEARRAHAAAAKAVQAAAAALDEALAEQQRRQVALAEALAAHEQAEHAARRARAHAEQTDRAALSARAQATRADEAEKEARERLRQRTEALDQAEAALDPGDR